MRTGRPLVWTQGQPFPGPLPDATISSETRIFVGVPMSVGGRVIGALSIGDRQPRPIEPRLVPLVTSIASHTVISDVKMPRLDGIELWNAVKRDDLAARFVFFTGDTLSPATAEFLERSGAPSLRKPFTSGDIRLALARVHDGAPRAEVAPQA